ncbi:hypothetical protein [Saccharospirillum impatiens]|uniref:hypothetical protein n=1 Tax=Saccharospirillum impatiens TaxID=169438 RepID=UPI00040F6C31|nr:hypothetical protein [Saccharospirillum impatiens]
MSLNISGLEHYQAHQQSHRTDTSSAAVDKASKARDATPTSEEDAVYVSDAVAVLEWVAAQAPDIESVQATEPANLGRLTGHLLQYNLITLQDAGRLMQLSEPAESTRDSSLLARIQTHSTGTEHYQESQSWQKLNRIVSNVQAAQ